MRQSPNVPAPQLRAAVFQIFDPSPLRASCRRLLGSMLALPPPLLNEVGSYTKSQASAGKWDQADSKARNLNGLPHLLLGTSADNCSCNLSFITMNPVELLHQWLQLAVDGVPGPEYPRTHRTNRAIHYCGYLFIA